MGIESDQEKTSMMMKRATNKTIILIAGLLLSSLLLERLCPAFELENDWAAIDIHGFLSQGYLQSDNNQFYADTQDGTFQFNEFGINFSSELIDRLRVGLQFLSRDLGSIGNNAIEIDWAYGAYHWKDWLGIQAGLFKTPWGLYNETRDLDMLRTPIFLPSSIYPEEARGIYNSILGVSIGGSIFSDSIGTFSYQLGFGEKDITQSIKTFDETPFLSFQEATVKNIVGGAIDWETPLDGLRLRATLGRYDFEASLKALWSPEEENAESSSPQWIDIHQRSLDNIYTIFSAEYTRGPLILAAEYYLQNEKHDDDREEGYYASAAYRFTDWFELGAYYSVSYPDANDKDGEKLHEEDGLPKFFAWQKEWVCTTRFDINEFWLIKLEGHFVNGVGRLNPGQISQLDEIEEDSFLFAMKTTFSF